VFIISKEAQMKKRYLAVFSLLVAGFYAANAANKTVVFQNGLDDYNGCTDAHIVNNMTSTTGSSLILVFEGKGG
jgi:hypothetical protein